MYISSLHVHLNMLQNKVILRSWVDNRTQETRWAYKFIHAQLMRIDHLIFRFFIIKKVVLLNTFIQENARMQSRCRWFDLFMMISISFFFLFIKCMQSMTMTLSRCCMYAKLHVIWLKSLLYIFSLINHINSLYIQALSLKLLQLYFCFSLFLHILRILLFHF